MQNKDLRLNICKALGIISLGIPMVDFMFILNWFFKITPYQNLGGLPLLLTPFICPIAIILGISSIKITPNKWIRLGIVVNVILFFAPAAYWYFGTLILGV